MQKISSKSKVVAKNYLGQTTGCSTLIPSQIIDWSTDRPKMDMEITPTQPLKLENSNPQKSLIEVCTTKNCEKKFQTQGDPTSNRFKTLSGDLSHRSNTHNIKIEGHTLSFLPQNAKLNRPNFFIVKIFKTFSKSIVVAKNYLGQTNGCNTLIPS